jgi:hypothetical protein
MHISTGIPHFRPSCPAGVRVRSAIAGTDSSDLSHSSHDDGQITPHHASFLDFLHDPTRAGVFYVDGSSQQIDLACHIVKIFSHIYQCSSWDLIVIRHLNWQRALEYVASAPPDDRLASLLYSIDPNWCREVPNPSREHITNKILRWLKVCLVAETDEKGSF